LDLKYVVGRKEMKPDYGLMLSRSGLGAVHQYLYGVPVTHLSASAPGLFTFLVNRLHDGIEYAVSLDFDSCCVADLLRKAEGHAAELSIKVSETPLGQTIEFPTPIVADIEAILGNAQRTDREQFVPLVVTRVV
jgi:hypothetical protein